MTGYNDIRDAVIKAVALTNPAAKIHGEEIQQGFNRPAFYIQLTPEAGNILNPAHRERSILVDIAYFPPDNSAQETRDMWTMADSLEQTFKNNLTVGDRVFSLKEPSSEIVDLVLHFTFNLEFIDSFDAITLDTESGDTLILVPDARLEGIGYTPESIELMGELQAKEEL
ncbi:MAG: hypothetical protein GXY34_12335 [Syntrophomonadaceae bacterium]|nr:hypothetical protein [Syntrophomonadaceae bacterium]